MKRKKLWKKAVREIKEEGMGQACLYAPPPKKKRKKKKGYTLPMNRMRPGDRSREQARGMQGGNQGGNEDSL